MFQSQGLLQLFSFDGRFHLCLLAAKEDNPHLRQVISIVLEERLKILVIADQLKTLRQTRRRNFAGIERQVLPLQIAAYNAMQQSLLDAMLLRLLQ